jgi:N-glycosylase/DNA lyase
MNYRGYKLTQEGNVLIVKGIKNFDAKHTFECGQCFRFIKQDNSYIGVAKNKVIKIKTKTDCIVFENTNINDFIGIWYNNC